MHGGRKHKVESTKSDSDNDVPKNSTSNDEGFAEWLAMRLAKAGISPKISFERHPGILAGCMRASWLVEPALAAEFWDAVLREYGSPPPPPPAPLAQFLYGQLWGKDSDKVDGKCVLKEAGLQFKSFLNRRRQ